MTIRLAVVHTLGGGIISSVDERLAWLNRSGGQVRATLVAPEKRCTNGLPGFFFPVKGDLPSSYHRDYEQTVSQAVIRALHEAYAKTRFDVIDAHDGTALIAASTVARQLGVRLIHTIHSHELIERFQKEPSSELHAAVDATDAFLAVSSYIAAQHRPILPMTVQVSRNPVPANVSSRTQQPSEGAVRAIFVGRVEKAKGFDLLLEAAEFLCQRFDLTITVVGSPVEEDLVERARKMTPRMRLTGRIVEPNRVFELLAQHDVFLFPTRKEACSMALLEAMGTGLAVIASDIEPNREVAGEAAIFHRTGDASHLAQCITELLQGTSDIQYLAGQAAERACKFAPEIVFKELDAVYVSLVSRNYPDRTFKSAGYSGHRE